MIWDSSRTRTSLQTRSYANSSTLSSMKSFYLSRVAIKDCWRRWPPRGSAETWSPIADTKTRLRGNYKFELIQDNSSCQNYMPTSFTLGTSNFYCGKLAVWDLKSKSRLVVRCERRQFTASKLLWNEEEWWQPSHRHLLLILPSKRYSSLHKA